MTVHAVSVVTGGAGFIGSHMVDLLLERGYRVRVIDNLIGGREENLRHHGTNPDLVFERRDIRSYQANASLFKGVRSVFHFTLPFAMSSATMNCLSPPSQENTNRSSTRIGLPPAPWTGA